MITFAAAAVFPEGVHNDHRFERASRRRQRFDGGTGVTVNSVLPGPTRSEGVEDFVKAMTKERGVFESEVERLFFAEIRPSSLLKRFAALRVDGGVVRSMA